ncbi:hypothetical protein ACFCYN_24955 [Gottfriedia sp. NPDC056225]|uniref:hypothetical protein n=1 Tax=Gottfriedia sp. NPDC056225 TaxID=3345751 RepID=UPI0035DF197D
MALFIKIFGNRMNKRVKEQYEISNGLHEEIFLKNNEWKNSTYLKKINDYFLTDEQFSKEEIKKILEELEEVKLFLSKEVYTELNNILCKLKDLDVLGVKIEGSYCDDTTLEIYETYNNTYNSQFQENKIYIISETILEGLQYMAIKNELNLLSNLDLYSDSYYKRFQIPSLIKELEFININASNIVLKISAKQLINVFSNASIKEGEYGVLFVGN